MSRNALASLADASRSGKRNQTILTPTWLTGKLIQEWGRIALDPCAEATDGGVPAETRWTIDDNGLSRPWVPFTYANVPFGAYKVWLEHAGKQAGPLAVLGPVRSHRRWYRAMVRLCDAVIELDPMAFVGFKATFPAPLVLLCRGWIPEPAIWADVGEVRFTQYLAPPVAVTEAA
jgi:hypothetical protein